jgi:hypothetical protein
MRDIVFPTQNVCVLVSVIRVQVFIAVCNGIISCYRYPTEAYVSSSYQRCQSSAGEI